MPGSRPFAEPMAAGAFVLVSLRVMAGGHLADAQAAGLLHEARELHLGVAARAGDGRPALPVVAHEGLDHSFAEGTLQAQHVVGDAEAGRHRLRVVEVVERAAAAEGRPRAVRLVVELHGDAHHLVPLLLEERGGHRGVDAAGHRGHHTHGFSIGARWGQAGRTSRPGTSPIRPR